MDTTRFNEIDYNYRPESYWEAMGQLQNILSRVKGTERRAMIKQAWEEGWLDQLDDSLLSEQSRYDLSRIHPRFMGGEYLPDLKKGEVEIARVELESTTADVISIRAGPEGERIRYSIVDEYDFEFQVVPETSDMPLSLNQLISLMDQAVDGESLGTIYTRSNYVDQGLESLDELRHFTHVRSDFYPSLEMHYKKVIDLWYEAEKARLERK